MEVLVRLNLPLLGLGYDALALVVGGVLLTTPMHAHAVEVQFQSSTDGYAFSGDEREAIESIANETEDEVRGLLPTLPGEIVVEVRTGRSVIEETGETGAAVSPGRVRWTVDPTRPEGVATIAESHLRATLFHEFHHLVRGWLLSGGAARASFMDGVVSEGMATAFQRDFAGSGVPWGDYPDDVDVWVEELRALPTDARYDRWMFLHPDGRRWIGYRAGTFLVDQAMRVSGKSAAELVSTPTDEIIRLGTSQ